MLTDYSVTCPSPGCRWSGCLFPSGDRQAWQGAIPTVKTVVFKCPRCHNEWHARVVGDDVFAIAPKDVVVSGA
jgi:hypothetical protein